ncbi:hypothetical protein [Vulcanisaeta distributa]|uniref:hypothetical protein n=1 Tax=Vulcanisaeta distributa TaxID=164451 RepID=UPI001FB1C945|nr:hypothetical protein [Vulcanisaeta distributa]
MMRSNIPDLKKDAIKAMAALTLIAIAMMPVMPHIIGIESYLESQQTGNPAWASAGYVGGGAGFAGVGATLLYIAINAYIAGTLPLWAAVALGTGGVALIGLGVYIA